MNEDFSNEKRYKIILNFFQSESCPFCKELKPVIDELEIDNDILDVRHIDWDKQTEICNLYGIEYVPTITLELKDYEMKRFHGIKKKEEYQMAIENILEIYDLLTNEDENQNGYN